MQSLKTKILQYLALFTLITTGLVGGFLLLYTRNWLIAESKINIERSAKDGAELIAARNENQFVYLEGIVKSNRVNFPSFISLSALRRIESEVLEYNSFMRVGVADLNGILYMPSKDKTYIQNIDISDRTYYQQALAGGRGFMNPSITINPEYQNQLVIAYAVPFYIGGKVSGVLVATSYSLLISELTSDMGYGDAGYAYILDDLGTVIAHPERSRIENKENVFELASSSEAYAMVSKTVQKALKATSGSAEYAFMDESFIVGYAAVPNSNWTIFITASRQDVLGILTPIIRGFLLVLCIILSLNVIIFLRIREIIAERNQEIQVENSRLTKMATLDGLTGAYNRSVVTPYVEESILDANFNATPLSAVFIDIDRLKYVNDTFGHDTGDDYIMCIVYAIRQFTRTSDRLFRLGGDEFLLLLNHCNESDALRILKNIEENFSFSIESVKPGISYGIVQYNRQKHPNASALIAEADEKMYTHKKSKRTIQSP